jgi:hypothetical protein
MRWMKLLERYSLVKRPTLTVVNPRVGTCVIPLDQSDGDIFFSYLTNKLHSLYFQGSEGQLTKIIQKLQVEQGFKIEKMKTTIGRGKSRLMLIHLKFPNDVEIRRLIKLT